MRTEEIVLCKERGVTLTTYLQDVGGEFGFMKRPAIVIVPGGGYAMCSDREAEPVALAYARAGFQAFVLRYTLKDKGGWPYPLDDFEQTMTMIENNAENWYVDSTKIAVAGFSAGGHLAACAATMAKHRPAAAIIVYPAILQELLDMCQPGLPCPYEYVTDSTCPCFLVAARDDRAADIRNMLAFEKGLCEHKIPFESYVYAYGGHGFSTADDWVVTNAVCERLSRWVDDSVCWLRETIGNLTRRGFTEPESRSSLNADDSPVLSAGCSMGHLRIQSETVQEYLQPVYEKVSFVAKEQEIDIEKMMNGIAGNTLREIMELLQYDEKSIRELDQKLHGIVNQIPIVF